MFNYQLLFYNLRLITYYMFHLYNIVRRKYIIKSDILLLKYNFKKYDKIHDLHILYCTFNIQIYTYTSTNYSKYLIYKDGNLISDLVIKDKNILNNKKIEIVSNILFIDNLNLFNNLSIYNCGIICHQNIFLKHYYNYQGERRDEIN